VRKGAGCRGGNRGEFLIPLTILFLRAVGYGQGRGKKSDDVYSHTVEVAGIKERGGKTKQGERVTSLI